MTEPRPAKFTTYLLHFVVTSLAVATGIILGGAGLYVLGRDAAADAVGRGTESVKGALNEHRAETRKLLIEARERDEEARRKAREENP